MSFGWRRLFSIGLIWTTVLFAHRAVGQDIDEILQGYRGVKKCKRDPNEERNHQHFFEYIDNQINNFPSNRKNDLFKQLSEHPGFQAAVKKCTDSVQVLETCDPSSPYRTYDGSCNNLKNPRMGSVGECLIRFLPASYEGTHGIRRSVTGGSLPRPRDLTVNICSGTVQPSPKYSFLLVMFSQFVAHDISLSTLTAGGSKLRCCPLSQKRDERCDPILIRPNDPFYSKFHHTCNENLRTDPCKKCALGKRQQANRVTAALDVSPVYGTTKGEAGSLRRFDGTGKLISLETNAGELLPNNQNPDLLFCPKDRTTSCFKSGDQRVNQHSFLMSIQTLLMREHNRIAEELKNLNPHWGEERLYQESRKISGGMYQNIVYNELLPELIGSELLNQNRLRVTRGPSGTVYEPDQPFGAWTEFSSCSFRFHNAVWSQIGIFNMTFKDLYSNTNLIRSGNMDTLLMSGSETPSSQIGKNFEKDVSGYLYLEPGASFGLDLPSIDIERGRDHGVRPYIDCLKFCFNNVQINNFDDLEFIMSPENIQLLKNNYADVGDVDAWLGMQMEDKMHDGLLGPTSACIVAKQFFFNKFADRFYFEHEGETPSFTNDQREALKHSTLSRMICYNTDICEMQENALLLPNSNNPMMPCESLRAVDLSAWKESR